VWSAAAMAFLLMLCSTQLQAATVNLAWDRNPESNIASYIISYGTSSKNYTTSVNVGNVATWSVSLATGSKYFFAAQAVNTAGLKSPYSAEVSADFTSPTAAPSIVNLSPTSGSVGTAVTINGANFGASQGTSSIKFNGTAAAPSSWTASSIVAPVPGGATSGSVVVTVNNVASNAVGFTVTSAQGPAISSLSPTSGAIGASVTITGSNFGATRGTSTVRFNGTAATPTSWSANSIVVPVPTGATTGPVSVTVNNVASNTLGFTVTSTQGPHITSLSPTSGLIGTSVTITGSNFGATRGTSAVRFNGIAATPTSWSASSIVVPVPTGATTGPVVVTVNNVASNAITFSIGTTLPAPWLSQDVGNPVAVGSVTYASSTGTFTVMGGGIDIWGTSDQFRFVYQPIDGDGQIVARVSNVQNQDSWSKAAVMIRQDLTGNSPHAMAAVTPSMGTVFQWRATRGGSSGSITGTAALAPQWVRVSRSGNSLSAYYSANGTSWTRMGTQTITMSTRVYVGLAVTSHKPSATGRGVFTNVTVTGKTTTSQTLTSLNAPASDATVQTASASVAPAEAATAPAATQPAKTTAGDYDGDGKTDLATYRASTGEWQILNSSTGKAATLVVHSAATADVPVPGDYDGDHKVDIAFYSPPTRAWSIENSSDGSHLDLFTSDDDGVPVPGDYDGDGKTDVATYSPSTGRWQILKSSAGFLTETTVTWGAESSIAVPGDYDGDGKADLAVYQAATGQWRILFSSTDFATSATFVLGDATNVPVPADYDGDGITDAAVYQSSTGKWLAKLSGQSSKVVTLATLGTGNDVPAPGDYDGDGRTDVAVFRNGRWEIRYSSLDYVSGATVSWGRRADVPLAGQP
jgi:regulation of enolase protein 1 (concanavalin A-like superfamily)